MPIGHREKRVWEPDPGAAGGRRRRKGGPYEVFIPAEIAGRSFSLREDAVNAVSAASKALARLNATNAAPHSLHALAANLLRSESAASSRIEGLQISQRRLARAAYTDRRGDGDHRAAQVLGNVEAMKRAIELGAVGQSLEVDGIKAIHETLLRFTADRGIAGLLREEQNWIGGNDYNPIGAAYVPPPPEYVPGLLEDLCGFAGRDDLAPVVQAAIVHAQFENIHPFADGNGRVGRALIYTVLRQRGEAPQYIPPISLILGREQKTYVSGFGSYSSGDVGAWVEIFAGASERAARKAADIAAAIERTQAIWIDRLGQPRKDATARELVAALPAQPVIDVAVGQQLTGRSHVAVQTALGQLEEAEIIHRLNERRWGRVWECAELLDLVEAYEEDIAS